MVKKRVRGKAKGMTHEEKDEALERFRMEDR